MPFLLLAFIVVPLVELFVIIEVGQAIGVIPTIMLLFLSAILGAVLLRSQGRAVWRRFNEALNERRVPHREVLDGVLVIFGGALLLTPGFVTDIVGILLLAPPSRAGIRSFMSKLLLGRVALGGRAAYWGYGRVRGRRSDGASDEAPKPGPTPRPAPADRSFDVEGTAQEVRGEQLLDPPNPSERT
ncbi:MAG: FxsA family protein [Solirubrobacterales bacterium]